ncbi:MAG: hypothetical protein KAJ14_07685 [Candidatus Omnitrophica bacterium]|nr:hypothetical protein [Candidatus Omnitrophota bacterium]
MTLLNLFTNEIMVSRLTVISGNRSVFATVTAEHVGIQRMADEKTVVLGGAIGKLFRMYAGENADIEKGDKLLNRDTGDEYKVTAVSIPAELGNFVHKECTILRVN